MVPRVRIFALLGALPLTACLETYPSYEMVKSSREMPVPPGRYQLCETQKNSCSDVTIRHGDAEMILTHKGDDFVLQADGASLADNWLVVAKLKGMAVFVWVDRHKDGVFHIQAPKCHAALLKKVRGDEAEAEGGRCRVSGQFQAAGYMHALFAEPADQRFDPTADMTLRPKSS